MMAASEMKGFNKGYRSISARNLARRKIHNAYCRKRVYFGRIGSYTVSLLYLTLYLGLPKLAITHLDRKKGFITHGDA
jgi:hypothetical protein